MIRCGSGATKVALLLFWLSLATGELVRPNSISQCKQCCARLSKDSSFDVQECQTLGCNETVTTLGEIKKIGRSFGIRCSSASCQIGRDWRLLGSSELYGSVYYCNEGIVTEEPPAPTLPVKALGGTNCKRCCSTLNTRLDGGMTKGPAYADDFTHTACLKGCVSSSDCTEEKLYALSTNEERLGCALGLDFKKHSQTKLRDLTVQCRPNKGNITVTSTSGVYPVSKSDCKSCCQSLKDTSSLDLDVAACQANGCDESTNQGSSISFSYSCPMVSGDAASLGCQIGRDLRLLGYTMIDTEEPGYCVNGKISKQPVTRFAGVGKSTFGDCRRCCDNLDKFFDAGFNSLPFYSDDFSKSHCEDGCSIATDDCKDNLEVSHSTYTWWNTHPKRLGCTIGKQFRSSGMGLFRDLAIQCNGAGSVHVTSYLNYATKESLLDQTTESPTTSQPSKEPTHIPTTTPPTLSPSRTPTLHPSNQPSTLSPTQRAKTESPSRQPTAAVTERPTSHPDGAPVKAPTNAPVSSPIKAPTSQPSSSTITQSPSANQMEATESPETVAPSSQTPSVSPTRRIDATFGLIGSSASRDSCDLEQGLCVPLIVYIVVFVVFLFLVSILVAFKSYGSDQDEKAAVGSFLSVFLALFDFLSDIFLVVELKGWTGSDTLQHLGNAALVFVVLPALTNVGLLVSISWSMVKSPEIYKWIERNSVLNTMVLFLGIVSVEAYALSASGIWLLTCPLTRRDIYKLRLYGFINNFVEDIPQIIIAILASRETGWTAFTTISLLTSLCSLMFSLLFRTTAALLYCQQHDTPEHNDMEKTGSNSSSSMPESSVGSSDDGESTDVMEAA